MRCFKNRVIILLTVFYVSAFTFADQVTLINGDKISGKILYLKNQKLKFQSDLAGALTIESSNISTFTTDRNVKIHFNDGTVINQKINPDEPQKIAITGEGILKAQTFHLSQISYINPGNVPPAPNITPQTAEAQTKAKADKLATEKDSSWKGAISVGLSSTHGNTNTEDRNLSLELSKRTDHDRITLNADYARGEQEDPDTGEDDVTENWWRTKAKYDYFLTKKLYLYAKNHYEKDSIAELDRRIIFAGGSGYQWVESEKLNFSTEAGLASVYEKYENQTDSKNELSAELSYHFDKIIWKNLKFINDTEWFPALDDPADYFLTSTLELRAQINDHLFSNFKIVFDYDSTPAEDTDKTDVKYMLGAGLSF